MKFEGILTVTLTPFDGDGAVDFDAYERLIEHVLDKGVHTVIPCGTTGEYYALSGDERRQIMTFVAERVDGRAKLLAGTNATTTNEVIDLSRFAREAGYEGVMLAAPYYSLPTPEELATHFEAVAEATQMPILLYNFPARTGVDLGPELLEALRPVDQVVGIKESSGSIARLHELLVNFADRYEIVCGADDQALEYFLWGSESWVAGASNFLPAEHVALYDTCVRKRDAEGGLKIMRKLLPLFMLMEQGGKYIQFCKYGCELAGVPTGGTRAPLTPLSSAERQRFAELYERAVA
jgi:4-hydroxy-tetrahydrodipicolinate synthase